MNMIESVKSIPSFINTNSIVFKRRNNFNKQKKKIKVMIESGLKVKEIKESTGVSFSTITRYKKELNGGGAVRVPRKEKLSKIIRLIKSSPDYSLTAVEIAKKLGITYSSVAREIRNCGRICHGKEIGKMKKVIVVDFDESNEQEERVGSPPRNSEYFHDGNYYKLGVHNKVFMYINKRWIRSGKCWNSISKDKSSVPVNCYEK